MVGFLLQRDQKQTYVRCFYVCSACGTRSSNNFYFAQDTCLLYSAIRSCARVTWRLISQLYMCGITVWDSSLQCLQLLQNATWECLLSDARGVWFCDETFTYNNNTNYNVTKNYFQKIAVNILIIIAVSHRSCECTYISSALVVKEGTRCETLAQLSDCTTIIVFSVFSLDSNMSLYKVGSKILSNVLVLTKFIVYSLSGMV